MSKVGLKSFGKNFLCGCQDFGVAKLVRLKVERENSENNVNIKEESGD